VSKTRQRRLRIVAIAAVVALTVPATSNVMADQSDSSNKRSAVSFLHTVTGNSELSSIDVYAGDTKILDDVKPGQLRTVKVPSGAGKVGVAPAGSSIEDSPWVTRSNRMSWPSDKHVTFTMHTDDDGKPEITRFVNKTRTVGRNMGRLTVRNLLSDTDIDVQAGGRSLLTDLSAADQGMVGVQSGKYRLLITESDDDAVLDRLTVRIRNEPGRSDMGNNVIVHVWNDAKTRNVRYTIQEVQLDLN
jgi:hypothetical protein